MFGPSVNDATRCIGSRFPFAVLVFQNESMRKDRSWSVYQVSIVTGAIALSYSCSLAETEAFMKAVAESIQSRHVCAEHKGEHLSFPFPGPHVLSSERISSSPLFPLISPEVLHVGAWVYLKIHSTQPIIPNQHACHTRSVMGYLNKYQKSKWFHNLNIEKTSRLNSNVERL